MPAPPLICLVTNRRALAPDARTLADECLALERQVDEAAAARIDLIQVRERDLEAGELRRLVARLLTNTRGRVRLLVNDRADVALAADADGVHLRGDGPDARAVRDLAPASWTIGRSVHSSAQAGGADATDYLIFGTVFPSRSKPSDARIAGVEGLAAAASSTNVPVLAIGGVNEGNVGSCRASGAAGVAGIEIFLPAGRSPDALGPAHAAAAIRTAWL